MKENLIFISKQQRISENTRYPPTTDINLAYNYVESIDIVAVDTENSGLDPHTGYEYCFQIGDENTQFVIDCLSFTYEDIRPLLEYENKIYVLQNAKYDLQWFYKHNIILKGKIWDTYLAELRLTNGYKGIRKNLQAIEAKYLQTNFIDKSTRKDIHIIPKIGYTDRVLRYSGNDVMVLPAIRKKQLEEAKKQEQIRIIEMECEYVKALAYSEYCGVFLNKDKWLEISIPNKLKLKELETKLDNWIVENKLYKYMDTQLSLFAEYNTRPVTINWNSNQQLIKLFEELGLDCTVIEKGKTKKTVEANHIKKQKDKSTLIPIYLEYASKAKEVSTYGEEFLKFINSKTGRIHPSYFQTLISGRMSSGGDEQTEDSRTANIMVIPREGSYRSCFTAQNPDNNILINYDYKQQEDVLFANQCKEPQLITLLKEGLDGHSYTAKIAFKEELKDIPLEEVKKERPDLRQKAKATKFAVNYGGSGYTIAKNLGLTKEEGEEIYNSYINGFPTMKEYFNKVEEEAINKGYILIDKILGSKYFIDGYDKFKALHKKLDFDNKDYWKEYRELKHNNPESNKFLKMKEEVSYYFRWKGAIRRHALNLPTQGTASQVTKIAGIYIFNEIIQRGWFNKAKITIWLHDEINGECSKDISEEFSKVMYESMIKAGKIYCKEVPLGASGGITEVWDH